MRHRKAGQKPSRKAIFLACLREARPSGKSAETEHKTLLEGPLSCLGNRRSIVRAAGETRPSATGTMRNVAIAGRSRSIAQRHGVRRGENFSRRIRPALRAPAPRPSSTTSIRIAATRRSSGTAADGRRSAPRVTDARRRRATAAWCACAPAQILSALDRPMPK